MQHISVGRLPARLAEARAEGRGVLVGFLPAGFPDADAFRVAVKGAFANGLDVLEVSLPGEVPALDGPIIARAAATAAQSAGEMDVVLRLAASTRAQLTDPVMLLVYPHQLAEIGVRALAAALASADLDAVLLPGTSMAEQIEAAAVFRAAGIEPVVFLHLFDEMAQLQALPADHTLRTAPPLIYLQSADMHTGAKFNPAKAVERLREMATELEGFEYRVVVGFGIRSASDVSTVISGGADGAVVGTALVEAASIGPTSLANLVAELSPRPAQPVGGR